MICEEARENLSAARHGRLPEPAAAALASHLEGCAACRHEDAAERALGEALAHRLPRRAAPASLKQRLESQLLAAPRGSPAAPDRLRSVAAGAGRPGRAERGVRGWRVPAAAFALGLAMAAAIALYYQRAVVPETRAVAQLETEAVNDHLRILNSEHPLEVESGGIHQVKPWFQGRVDFAPVVPFAGDAEFPLQGGAVSWVLDRKAATFIFKRRLHTISLFVFRSDGLSWPTSGLVPVGRAMARPARVRGYNLLLWRDGELGYALVSDVDAGELAMLGAHIATRP
jgi:anti-sigma factor RsiW